MIRVEMFDADGSLRVEEHPNDGLATLHDEDRQEALIRVVVAVRAELPAYVWEVLR